MSIESIMIRENRPGHRGPAFSLPLQAAVRMVIAPPRSAAIGETPVTPGEAAMAPAAMVATMEAMSPGRCRGRRERGGAESGGRDESEAHFAQHDDFSSGVGCAFC